MNQDQAIRGAVRSGQVRILFTGGKRRRRVQTLDFHDEIHESRVYFLEGCSTRRTVPVRTSVTHHWSYSSSSVARAMTVVAPTFSKVPHLGQEESSTVCTPQPA